MPCIIQFLPCRSPYDRISRIPPDKYRSQMRFVRSQVLSLRAVRDSTIEDSTNKKKSGVARFKRFVTKLACCVGMGDSERKFCESKCARIRFCLSGGSGSIGLIADYESPCPVSRGRRIVKGVISHVHPSPLAPASRLRKNITTKNKRTSWLRFVIC